MKSNFLLYHDTLSVIEELTDEQAGKLIKEIYAYSLHINNPEEAKEPSGLIGLLNSVCHPFKKQLERDVAAYHEKTEINRQNGLKGGRPKNENNPIKAKKGDKDPDKDTDKDTDKKEKIVKTISVEDKSPTPISKKNKFDDFQITVAQTLGTCVKNQQGRNVTKAQAESWANEVRLLMESDLKGRDNVQDDITQAMQAVLDKWGQPFFPVVESGGSFRKKFFKIERYLKNNQRGNNGNSEVKPGSVEAQQLEMLREINAGKYLAPEQPTTADYVF